ncbi:MAG: hypothetical protein AAAC47_14425, partial [Pararhizobium sp.]
VMHIPPCQRVSISSASNREKETAPPSLVQLFATKPSLSQSDTPLAVTFACNAVPLSRTVLPVLERDLRLEQRDSRPGRGR